MKKPHTSTCSQHICVHTYSLRNKRTHLHHVFVCIHTYCAWTSQCVCMRTSAYARDSYRLRRRNAGFVSQAGSGSKRAALRHGWTLVCRLMCIGVLRKRTESVRICAQLGGEKGGGFQREHEHVCTCMYIYIYLICIGMLRKRTV